MSISSSVAIGDGLFVPFFQDVRGGKEGKSPVGTVNVDLSDVGEAGGGTVTLSLTMTREIFGFRAIVAPTLIVAADTLATAEAIRMQATFTGNRRLGNHMEQAVLALAAQGQNVAKFEESGLVFESDLLDETTILSFVWSTNTDTKIYNFRLFGAVFDAEIIEAEGSISDFLAGVR